MRTAVYVAVALALTVFGYFTLFSIGFPLALTGLLMLVLLGQRHRTDVLAPAIVWPWVFTLGYLLVAPLGCASSGAAPAGAPIIQESTRCGALFMTYAGGPDYDPPLLPALLTGIALATAVSLAIRWTLRRRRAQGPTPAGRAPPGTGPPCGTHAQLVTFDPTYAFSRLRTFMQG